MAQRVDSNGQPPRHTRWGFVLRLEALVLGLAAGFTALRLMAYGSQNYHQLLVVRSGHGAASPLIASVLVEGLYWVAWAALVPAIGCVAGWLQRRSSSRWRRNAGHAGASLVLGSLHAVLLGGLCFACWIVFSWFSIAWREDLVSTYLAVVLPFELASPAVYVALAVLCNHFDPGSRRQQELTSARLETALAQARLEALTGQLRPHFLFNVLNSIAALVTRDPPGAERMVELLGDLLRRSIEVSPTTSVTLAEELECLDLYLTIEEIRFDERLNTEVDVSDDALGALVPHFLLQPVVENAVRHAIAPYSRPGLIRIEGEVEEDWLVIRVIDNGPGLTGGRSSSPGLGVGLRNTRQRLSILYGQQFELRDRQPFGGRHDDAGHHPVPSSWCRRAVSFKLEDRGTGHQQELPMAAAGTLTGVKDEDLDRG